MGGPCPISISAALHKYGYAPTGISSLMLRRAEDRETIGFSFDGWDGTHYASAAVAGIRNVVPLAGAWATMLQLGRDGRAERAAADLAAPPRLR